MIITTSMEIYFNVFFYPSSVKEAVKIGSDQSEWTAVL